MKKKLFFAAVVATALAGCSSNENLENDLANVANPVAQGDGRVPIVLGLTSNDVQVLKTRGTGTVGDLNTATGTTNIYRNEDLWVLMTTVGKENWDFTDHGPEDPEILGKQFDGTFKARPYGYEDALGTLQRYGEFAAYDDALAAMANNGQWGLDYLSYNGGQMKYYPTDGTASDFFAFHIDDAATLVAQADPLKDHGYDIPTITPVAAEGDNPAKMTVDFTINGSQDILAGKADNGLALTNPADRTGFTAKAAREGLIPTIPMKHLLTRLTFDLVPGHQDAKGVIVQSITVKGQASAGTLTVAFDKEGNIGSEEEDAFKPEDLIAWDTEAAAVNFQLMKSDPEEAYRPVTPTGNPSEQGYYEFDGVEYNLTVDTEVDEDKTYYEKIEIVIDQTTGAKKSLVDVVTPFDDQNDATYLAVITDQNDASETDDNGTPADPSDDVTWNDPGYAATGANIVVNPPAEPGAEPTYTFTPARMGEAMFIAPGQEEVEVEAVMKFPIEGYNERYLSRTYKFYVRIPNGDELTPLEIGHSYNVQLKVYGLTKVQLRTTLEAWQDHGEDLVIDMDVNDHTKTWEDLNPEPAADPEP